MASVLYVLIQHGRMRIKDVALGITSEFMCGWVERISSLGCMVYGAL